MSLVVMYLQSHKLYFCFRLFSQVLLNLDRSSSLITPSIQPPLPPMSPVLMSFILYHLGKKNRPIPETKTDLIATPPYA